MTDQISRVDRYTIVVNGHRVRATQEQEKHIRALNEQERERFLLVMGLKETERGN